VSGQPTTRAYVPHYVNEDGDAWIERGIAPWPRIQREGFAALDEMGSDATNYRRTYEGIDRECRVSDVNEYVHGDDDGCADAQGIDYNDPAFRPCCRTIEAHHFRAVER
jgi:hypothetical protein